MTPPPQQPTINPRNFVVLATISGVVLCAIVLLWVLEVVPFGVFIGVVAVVAVAQAVVVFLMMRGARRRASGSDRTPGGASPVGPDGPGARYGYDPMSELDRDQRR